MKVGASRGPGLLLFCLGIVLAGLGLVVAGSLADPGLADYGPVISGAACALAGIALASRTVFELTDREVVVYALLGPRRWRYPFARLADVRILGDRIVIGERPLPVLEYRCNPRDWAALTKKLRQAASIPSGPGPD